MQHPSRIGFSLRRLSSHWRQLGLRPTRPSSSTIANSVSWNGSSCSWCCCRSSTASRHLRATEQSSAPCGRSATAPGCLPPADGKGLVSVSEAQKLAFLVGIGAAVVSAIGIPCHRHQRQRRLHCLHGIVPEILAKSLVDWASSQQSSRPCCPQGNIRNPSWMRSAKASEANSRKSHVTLRSIQPRPGLRKYFPNRGRLVDRGSRRGLPRSARGLLRGTGLRAGAPGPARNRRLRCAQHSLPAANLAEPSHPVGCARLVLADPRDPAAPAAFEKPVPTLDRSIIDPSKLHRGKIAEVSRLAVRSPFRRRKGEKQTAVAIQDEDFGSTEQPRFPYIPIGLYLGAVAMAKRRGIETLSCSRSHGCSPISPSSA